MHKVMGLEDIEGDAMDSPSIFGFTKQRQYLIAQTVQQSAETQGSVLSCDSRSGDTAMAADDTALSVTLTKDSGPKTSGGGRQPAT